MIAQVVAGPVDAEAILESRLEAMEYDGCARVVGRVRGREEEWRA